MSANHSNRNLLFGVLSLQIDFINRDSLTKALNDLGLDNTRMLGEILVANKVLSSQYRDLLEQMVDAHIAAHQGDPEKSLASLSSINSLLGSSEKIDARKLIESLQHLSDATLPYQEDMTTPKIGNLSSVSETAGINTRFRIIRLHAEGGLGKVSLAEDCELKREVAIKEIKDKHAHNEDVRARFTQEAEVTGALEHPNIVPVYGLGHRSDGQPFYAMRFIKGDSLKDACLKFHESKGTRSASETTLEFRKLLGRFIDVCNAIAYAHSRGVLHRDLKPGNIMLGKYGETLVVDWGLSKIIGQNEAFKNLDEEMMCVNAANHSPKTQMGSAVGTPNFMSPEQASGNLNELGPTSDVYSLGATLYYLLTNRAPFQQQEMAIVLTKVKLGEFEKPRSIDPSIPVALESICLKAMALRPQDRYTTPNELASDIDRWLADEPVSAMQEPWITRVNRWHRKHPRITATVSATVLIGLISMIAIAIVTNNANRFIRTAFLAEQNALQQAKTQQQRANDEAARARASESAAKFQLARARWDARRPADAQALISELPAESQANIESQISIREFAGGFLTLAMQGEEIHDFAFLNSRELLTVSDHGNLVLWDLHTGESLRSYKFEFPLTSICVAPNYAHIAISDAQGHVTIRNFNFEEIRTWRASEGSVLDIRYLNGSKQLITCVKNERDEFAAFVWNVENGELINGFSNRGDPIWRIHTGQSTIISCGNDFTSTIQFWGLEKGETQTKLEGHQWTITAGEFSPTGELFASSSRDKTVILWDLRKKERIHTLEAHAESVRDVCFSPSGQQLASCGNDHTIRLWNVLDGKLIQTYYGHHTTVKKIDYSPDGSVIASCSDDGTLKLWEVSEPQLPISYRGHIDIVNDIDISDDGNFMVSGCSDRSLRLWNLRQGRLKEAIFEEEAVESVAIQPSGTLVAYGTSSGTLKRLDYKECKVRQFIGDDENSSPIRCIEFSRDGKSVVTGQANGDVKLWDVSSSTYVKTLAKNTSPVLSLAFSNDSEKLAIGTGNETIVIMNGDRIGQEEDDNLIKVINLSNPEEIVELQGHAGRITAVSFGINAQQLLSSSTDRTIRIWNLQELNSQPSILSGHLAPVSALVYRHRRIISADSTGVIKLWELNTGKELMQLENQRLPIRTLASNSKGTIFAAAGGNPAIYSAISNRVFGAPLFSILVWNMDSSSQAQYIEQKCRLQPEWHEEQMIAAEQNNNPFGAIFHASWLLKIDPLSRRGFDSLHRIYKNYPENAALSFPNLVHESLKIPKPPVPKLSRIQAGEVNQKIWKQSISPNSVLSESDIEWIESVVRDFPNPDFFNTLGLAHYRNGNDSKAIEACLKSIELTSQQSDNFEPHPIDLAILVMAHHRLGKMTDAIEYFRKLNTAISQTPFKDDKEISEFAKEVEKQLGEPIEIQ